MSTVAEMVRDRRVLLAEITSIEHELNTIERRHGHGHEAVVDARARVAAARKSVCTQLYMLLESDGTTH